MEYQSLISALSIVALAEFGDKTQLAAIVLSTRYKPMYVFLSALLAVSLVGGASVVAGKVLTAFIPTFWISLVSGIVFIFFGIFTLRSRNASIVNISDKKLNFITPFSLIALAELGDKTQLAIIALVATHGTPLLIFLGAFLAYTILMGVAVTMGLNLTRLIPIRYIRIGASITFILFGIIFLLGVY